MPDGSGLAARVSPSTRWRLRTTLCASGGRVLGWAAYLATRTLTTEIRTGFRRLLDCRHQIEHSLSILFTHEFPDRYYVTEPMVLLTTAAIC